MKIFNINWTDFFEGLEKWQLLDVQARDKYLAVSDPFKLLRDPEIYGNSCTPMLQAGFLLQSSDGKKVKCNKKYRPFHRIVSALKHFFALDLRNEYICFQYLKYHYLAEEINRIQGDKIGQRELAKNEIYHYVSSEEYLDGFLKLKKYQRWEYYRCSQIEKTLLTDQHSFELCQTLLQCLLDHGELIPFANLLSQMKQYKKDITQSELSYSLYVCLRYMFIVATMDKNKLEPLVGLWPRVLERKQRVKLASLEPKQSKDSILHPFVFYDMCVVWEECSLEPVRVRGNDYAMYAKATKALAEKLTTLPDFLLEKLDIDNQLRVEKARSFLQSLMFINLKGYQGKDLRLEVTKEGKLWYEQPMKERLRTVLDSLEVRALRQRLETDANQKKPSLRYLSEVDFFSRYYDLDISPHLFQCMDHLPTDQFVSYKEFEVYCGLYMNPFFEKKESRKFYSRWKYSQMPKTAEEKEAKWEKFLNRFITTHLIYWGGVHIGLNPNEETVIKKSGIGRYLLGEVDDFEFAPPNTHQIVVQPNFEIVFLEHAPHPESILSSFSERIGHGIGNLFQITQSSIKNAAAKGITLEQILESLNNLSTKHIPANVKHEIEAWYGQVRTINMHNALIIRCPDEETADLVQSIGGKKLEPLTEKILMCRTLKEKKTLVKKLKEKGVFVKN